MVSQLLYELPSSQRYRIIFMERDLDEILLSQEKMLARLGKPAAPRAAIKRAFIEHLHKLRQWLVRQSNIEVLYVCYNDLLEWPAGQADRIQRVPQQQGGLSKHGKDGGPIALQESAGSDRKSRRTRRGGAGLTKGLSIRYHDEEWGVPLHDDRRWFQVLVPQERLLVSAPIYRQSGMSV